MPNTLPSKKKISTATAAKFLGVSRWTLRRWGDKKLISFTTSRSGYRFYTDEDLQALLQKHAVVHVVSKKKTAQKERRDETLLLPSPPKPDIESAVETVVEAAVESVAAPVQPEVVVKESEPLVVSPVREEAMPETVTPAGLVVPPPQSNAAGTFDVPLPNPPTPPKKSILSGLWKILPFTGAAVFLLAVFLPAKFPLHTKEAPQAILTVPVKQSSPIGSLLSFREVVMAAATDSSELASSSVEFFLSGSTEPVDSMLDSDGKTPQSGNTIYLSNMTNFASFQESPFAYLNGSHGAAGPVAIIENAEVLREHPFFANVHNGDKLLIYKESAKAILFRPMTNEVIAFAPLDAIPSTSYAQVKGSPVVALRNGMGTPYDMKTFEAELTYVAPESVAVDNEAAGKSDYKKSIIVDVVGNKTAEAQTLAQKLRLTVSQLPDGEYRPPAGVDFLIILGKDRVSLMNYIAPSSTASATPK